MFHNKRSISFKYKSLMDYKSLFFKKNFPPYLRHESYLEDMYQEFGVINAVSRYMYINM